MTSTPDGGRLWHLRIELPTEAVEEALEDLAAGGCSGTWQHPGVGRDAPLRTDDAREPTSEKTLVDAWFEGRELPGGLRRRLEELGAKTIGWQPAEERDWLEEYRRSAQPTVVGRFELDPREPGATEEDGLGDRHRLLLPARSAFGTGSHETTRLVVQALQELDLERRSVLDVGTGTGVLSFVALLLGAEPVVGFDLDPTASLLAAQNARLNRLAPRLFAGPISTLRAGARFDLVLVNVLPENLGGNEPEIAARVASRGELLLSGILTERAAEIGARWRSLGLDPIGSRAMGEWTLLHLGRAS